MHFSMESVLSLIAGILVGLAIVAFSRRKRNQ
jgi:LPXTG-motif cell wall-anchored protein